MELHKRDIRKDVKELGSILGEVIKKDSNKKFEIVESIRKKAIDSREKNKSHKELKKEIESLSPEMQFTVAKAFTIYFELVNLAEERQRIRKIRQRSNKGNLENTFEEALKKINSEDEKKLEKILNETLIIPTFTAHPTEARRKSIKAKLNLISEFLENLDEKSLTNSEERNIRTKLKSEIDGIWRTSQIRQRRPEPLDEVNNIHWYLENTLFNVIGDFYLENQYTINKYSESIQVPKLFEFRSWAGSDSDGNPYITPEITKKTLEMQEKKAISLYKKELENLLDVLTHDRKNIVMDPLEDNFRVIKNTLPDLVEDILEKYPNEPYRRMISIMLNKLDRTARDCSLGYSDPQEFCSDLEDIKKSLIKSGADSIAKVQIEPLIKKIKTFGFTLAPLDLRDHRSNHTKAITEVLNRNKVQYKEFSEKQRVEFLTNSILKDKRIIDLNDKSELSESSREILSRFSNLKKWHSEYGEESIDTYCISMTEKKSHILEVLFLANQAGIVNIPGKSGIDIVPLFETASALENSPRIMDELFQNQAYLEALKARDKKQEIMLGYSDSNKENGFMATNWYLYKNEKKLASVANNHNIKLRFFHGRGGSIPRGGGSTNRAILALPNEASMGEIKFTEQGEAIDERYGNKRIAKRNLEQTLNAQIRVINRSIKEPSDNISDNWKEAIDIISKNAKTSYRSLLDTEGFLKYFNQATPINTIEKLKLGSRPASRTGKRNIEDLRAIPWVFSWTQSRCIIPGWYSLSSGINSYLENGNIDTLRSMYKNWRFFSTVLDNAALSLAKSDMRIAKEYALLADNYEKFYTQIREEYKTAKDLILKITQRDSLTGKNWLDKSVSRRNPYLDPLNLLQSHLLSKDNLSEKEKKILRLTVMGIAAGMKNTG